MLWRVLITECIKLKRTLALAMAFIAPSVVILLYTLIGHFGAPQLEAAHYNYWRDMTSNAVMLWALLMLPLFITLETSLLAGLEHADKNWKSLLALPAPRWTIYVSKLVVTVLIVCLAHAVLVGGIVLGGLLLKWLHPAIMPALPLRPLVVPVAKLTAATMLAITIQHWISLRWQSFTAALGFGMSAMLVGFVAANSKEYSPFVPWSLPLYTIRATTQDAITMLAYALIAAFVLAWAGAWEFGRRDISN